ncbi:MAG: secretin N-terminal domain-containing protein [Rubrivivax sp.]
MTFLAPSGDRVGKPYRRADARWLAALLLLALGACATRPPQILPKRDVAPYEKALGGQASPNSAALAGEVEAEPARTGADRMFQTPPAPRARSDVALPSPAGTPPPADPTLETAVALEQLPLPVFIDTVFGSILKRNISVDPAVAERKEIVSLKSGKPQTATGLYDAARSVLKSFGVAMTEYNGLIRFTSATGPTGLLPELRRGRSLPDVPAAVRPVFQIVGLEAVSPATIINSLRTIFGRRLTIQDDLGEQALILSGQSDDVAAGIAAIRLLDQPSMRGRVSARLAPLFWSADEMAKRLAEIMQAQGYAVGTTAQAQAPIILLPVAPLNSVIVFTRSEEILNYVLRWAADIDQPASGRGSAGYFTYAVRNLDASDLAKTLQEVMTPAPGVPGAAGAVRSRVVVNASSNTLIIQGSPTEYQQWFGLLQELDRPPRSALVSVTVAEIRLDDGEQLGFEWMLNQFRVDGNNFNVSTLGAFGTTAIGGLSAVISRVGSVSPRAVFNALASTSRVRVLANPSVMARNGETASIQVGSEVPVVTSQQTTTGTIAGNTVPGGTTGGLQAGILQSIQYRSTGVILKVKPVIHAGGRIDLDVEQEVSSASATLSGVTASPTIATRRITTKLSVTDGATVLLGGLMQETATNADTGVPLLKDVPVFGYLFKSNNVTRVRTELVVLITPYVLDDEFEARAITNAFKGQFSWSTDTAAQQLRPPNSFRGNAQPANPLQNVAPPTPYVLPPLPGIDQTGKQTSPETPAGERLAPSGAIITRPDFSSAPSTSSGARTPAAPAVNPDVSDTRSSTTKLVTDPEILKELQKTLKPK